MTRLNTALKTRPFSTIEYRGKGENENVYMNAHPCSFKSSTHVYSSPGSCVDAFCGLIYFPDRITVRFLVLRWNEVTRTFSTSFKRHNDTDHAKFCPLIP